MNAIKKFFSILSAVMIFVLCFNISSFAAVTHTELPVTSDDAELKWSVKFGNGYKDSPSVPAIHGDYLYVMSGNTLLKLDKDNGKTVQSVNMTDEPCFGYTPVTIIDSYIFCPLDNGTVQAFDIDSMKSLWVYTNKLGGQALTEIKYSDGCLYVAFWNDEEADADFVCINTRSGKEIWSYTHKGGFYWSECCFYGRYVIIGGDNGSGKDDAAAMLHCFDKSTGKLIDTEKIYGDQRSGITEYNGDFYFVTKAGYLYKTSVSSDGKFKNTSSLRLSGASTSTPVIHDGIVYIGVQSTGFSGNINIIDADKMKLIYSLELSGYPQAEVLVCDAFYAETSEVYVYVTYNSPPGGIAVLNYSSVLGKVQYEDLFIPENGYQGYCISPVIEDSEGTMYYKNDSGTIFAVSNASENDSSFFNLLIRLFMSVINFITKLFL